MKVIFTFLSILFLSSCFGGSVHVKLTVNDIKFVAIPSDYEEKIQGGYKVSGELKIINGSSKAISFSNKDLYLVILNEGESRTYVDSIASSAIDFSAIEIENGRTLNQKVYWVLPAVKSLKAEQLVLEWRK